MGQRYRLDLDWPFPLPVFAHIRRRHMEILLLDVTITDKLFGHWQPFRHGKLVIKPTLIHLKRGRKGENSLAMLLCQNAPRAEARPVTDTIHLIDNRDRRVAGSHEIGMQGMDVPFWLNCALRSDQRLPDHLPTENPLPANLWAVAAEQVHFKRFQIEDGKKLTHCRRLLDPGLFFIRHGQPASRNHICFTKFERHV